MTVQPHLPRLDGRIEAEESELLQRTVVEKLLQQSREVVLHHASSSTATGPMVAGLQALQDLPQKMQQEIILHPCYRYWLQGMRRMRTDQGEDLRNYLAERFADFVWPTQCVLGDFGGYWTSATDGRGGLRCPPFGRVIELGTQYSNQPVRIALTDSGVTLTCQDGLIVKVPRSDFTGSVEEPLPTQEQHGYFLNISPLLIDGRVEVTNRDEWLRIRVTGTNQRTTGTVFFGTSDRIYPKAPCISYLEDALALISSCWDEAYSDISKFVRVIVPIDFDLAIEEDRSAGKELTACKGWTTYRAFTVSSRQGAIYIGAAPPRDAAEMIMHEYAHVKLRQIQALDPLLKDPLDESVRVPVPWRRDPRPIPGILEGLFVFAHVSELEIRASQQGGHVEKSNVMKRIDGLVHALEIIKQHGSLTEIGCKFLNGMEQWVNLLRIRAGHE
jgi:hypothetical protein